MAVRKEPPVYAPVAYTASDVSAFQALARGDCPEHLQKQALDFIINRACATYDQSFRVDPCETAFAEGRRFAGNTILKLLKLDASKVAGKEPGEQI